MGKSLPGISERRWILYFEQQWVCLQHRCSQVLCISFKNKIKSHTNYKVEKKLYRKQHNRKDQNTVQESGKETAKILRSPGYCLGLFFFSTNFLNLIFSQPDEFPFPLLLLVPPTDFSSPPYPLLLHFPSETSRPPRDINQRQHNKLQ